jgi:hypothetical protein
VCDPRQKDHHHTQGHTTGQKDPRREKLRHRNSPRTSAGYVLTHKCYFYIFT